MFIIRKNLKMKKLFLVLLLFVFGGVAAQTVYITNTGQKYHTGGCRYLSKSKIAIELKNAVNQNYVACKVCGPPQTGQTKKNDNNTNTETVSTQCSATTKKGSR